MLMYVVAIIFLTILVILLSMTVISQTKQIVFYKKEVDSITKKFWDMSKIANDHSVITKQVLEVNAQLRQMLAVGSTLHRGQHPPAKKSEYDGEA